jgi:hypothetical protein
LNNKNIIEIKNIKIGDVLEDGEIVRGIVLINGQTIDQQYEYIIGDKLIVGAPNLVIGDKNIKTISTMNLDDNYKKVKNFKETILYHLLTDKKCFNVEKTKFFDYNASIDQFLEKYKKKLLSMKYV